MRTEIIIDDTLVPRLQEAADAAKITFEEAVRRAVVYGLESLPKKIQPKAATYLPSPTILEHPWTIPRGCWPGWTTRRIEIGQPLPGFRTIDPVESA